MRFRLGFVAMTAVLAGCMTPVPDSLPETQARVGVVQGAAPIAGPATTTTALSGAPLTSAPAVMPAAPSAGPAAGASTFSTDALGAAIDRAAGAAPAPAPVMVPDQPAAVIGADLAPQPTSSAPPLSALEVPPVPPVAPAGVDPTVDSLDPLLHGQPAVLGVAAPQPAAPTPPAEPVAPAAAEVAPVAAPVAAEVAPPAAPVQPLPMPEGEGANVVKFALSTSHAKGTPVYERSSLQLGNPKAACARFASSDKAQQAFLEAGGPERDRKGLDPDGDGFACDWDPSPFRAALQ